MLPPAGPVVPTDLLRFIATERVTVAGLTGWACPGARLLNAYGLTETTITFTLLDVGPDLGTGRPGGGRPRAPARAGARARRAPGPGAVGEAGEVYIGGCGVIYHAGAVVNFIYPYEELRAPQMSLAPAS